MILQVELLEELLAGVHERAGREGDDLFMVLDWARENGLVLEPELEQWRRGLTMRIKILADSDHTQPLEQLASHAELLGVINARVDDRIKGYELLTEPGSDPA